MNIKKYALILFVAFCFFQTNSNAQQSDVTAIWKDSSKVSTKNRAQFSAFSHNANIYPARPKDMWEIGLGLGTAYISGDLNSNIGVGAMLTARKSLSHVFSLRPYFSFQKLSGTADPAFTAILKDARDYKTKSFGSGIDLIASLNTIRNYKGNPKANFYVLMGVGFLSAHVEKKNDLGNYGIYYNPSNSNVVMSFGTKKGPNGSTVVVPTVNLGVGFAYKISDRFNLGIEGRNSLTNYDYLEGFGSQFSNAFDAIWFHTLRLNVNLGNADKKVQPLWWINPNNYIYSELNAPDHLKNKLKVKLDDADGDGITDQFDLEPNTPAGVAVDSRGRALDSDGDGIPDFRDKELLTRQECFPVNADGVGNCPETPCCKESKSEIIKLNRTIDSFRNGNIKFSGSGNCAINNLPSIVFKSGGASLGRDNMRLLDAVATQLKDNPSCKVKVLGHPEANKSSQQKSYDRVESIIKYLVEKQGISEGRFIFAYDAGSGDGNTIDLQGTTEEGPNTVPAPAPHLKGRQNF